jgi:hypothetical protein
VTPSADSATTVTRGSRIITTRVFVVAAALLSAVVLLALLLLASTRASKPGPRAGVVAVQAASSAVQAAEKQPASSMLRASGFAIVKDKLD